MKKTLFEEDILYDEHVLYRWHFGLWRSSLQMTFWIMRTFFKDDMFGLWRRRVGILLICSSFICSFAKITQDKWANVSDFLRYLRTNERMSESLVFFEQIGHFLVCSQKVSDSLKKIRKNRIFVRFYSKKRKRFAHFVWAKKWANRSGRSGIMSNRDRFAQVAQKESAIVNESLRSLTKNEQMSKSLTFWANRSFAHIFILFLNTHSFNPQICDMTLTRVGSRVLFRYYFRQRKIYWIKNDYYHANFFFLNIIIYFRLVSLSLSWLNTDFSI